jgi:hypothetical protein
LYDVFRLNRKDIILKKDIARKTYLKKRQEQVPATFEAVFTSSP